MTYSTYEGVATGRRNMDRDLELVAMVEQQSFIAAFRTYEWSPWTLSLGKHQSLDVVDRHCIEDRGYDVVHRPTGGRAVFHANELTYALAVRSDQPMLVYEHMHRLLRDALESLLPGQLDHTSTPADLRQHYASSGPLGAACFTAHARTELVANGRKIVGSAQRVLGSVVLQHGSILCGPEHQQLPDLLVLQSDQKHRMREALQSSSVSLQELGATLHTPVDVARHLHVHVTPEALATVFSAP